MIEQVFIALTELIAIWLIQDKRFEYRKFACVFGLLGQPFWFYASYTASQWGSFVLCFFFTAAWLKALKEYWIDQKNTLTNEQYWILIEDAIDKLENKSRMDYKDYLKRIVKESLSIK